MYIDLDVSRGGMRMDVRRVLLGISSAVWPCIDSFSAIFGPLTSYQKFVALQVLLLAMFVAVTNRSASAAGEKRRSSSIEQAAH